MSDAALVVPYIAAWEAETADASLIVLNPRGGIAYAEETPYDRDDFGALWARRALRRGKGKPLLGEVHPQRQRRTMGGLSCQVCTGRPDETEDGILWLLDIGKGARPLQKVERTTQPPICTPCAAVTIDRCPAARRGYFLVRAKAPTIDGVYGAVYRPAFPIPIPGAEPQLVPYLDPRTGRRNPEIRLVLAQQLYATLRNPVPVESTELRFAA